MKKTTKISTLLVAIFFAVNMFATESSNTLSAPPKATTTTKTKTSTTKTTQPAKTTTPAKTKQPENGSITKTIQTKDGSTLKVTSDKDKTTITRTGSAQPPKTKSKTQKNESANKAFEGKGSKTISIGLGGSSFNAWFPTNGRGPMKWWHPFYGTLNVQTEFGVHKYVGVGFNIGVGACRNLNGFSRYSALLGYNEYSSFWSVSIPVAVAANFHFYQLIEDKTKKNIHGDKLDLYAGANLGAGPAFAFAKKGLTDNNGNPLKGDVGYVIFGGIQVGVKYYPKSKVGMFLEVGYGKTLVNGGVSFKM